MFLFFFSFWTSVVQPWMIIKLQKPLGVSPYLALCLQQAAKTGAFLDLNMSASLGLEVGGRGGFPKLRAFCALA